MSKKPGTRTGLEVVSRRGTRALYLRGTIRGQSLPKVLALTIRRSPKKHAPRGKPSSTVVPFSEPSRR